LRQTTMLRPEYSQKFSCIGAACEDTCCAGWIVGIDQATYEKYQAIPQGPLRALIERSIERTEAGASPAQFAVIRQLPSHACPFHSADRLCQIQVEHGEGFLSPTCANYPRTAHTIDKLEEQSLMLSCPEAARLVLTNRNLLAPLGTGVYHFTWDETASVSDPRFYFWPIREFTIGLVRNRAYPLWQRLFLLGTFVRRLDGIVRGEVDRTIPAFLRDFAAATASGNLRASMETVPAALGLQLEIVLRFVNLRLGNAFLGPRLTECLTAFASGVGDDPEMPMERRIERYVTAHRDHFLPFILKHPHVLENYLVNNLFRGLFPFGDRLRDPTAPLQMTREFSALAIQFSLIKGLLIGVAGYYKRAFSVEHVVQTIQTATKHFEHFPEFLLQAQQLLAMKNLDNAPGLTMLLRN